MANIYTLTDQEKDALEAMLDRTSLATVLEGLSEVCDYKEAHVRSHWQDFHRARQWHRASCRLVKVAGEVGDPALDEVPPSRIFR